MATEKKTHLYIVTVDIDADPAHYCVRAYTRQQAVQAIASKHIKATRAEAEDMLKFRVRDDGIIDATVDAAQEELPLKTAAEQMETDGNGSE